MRVREDNGWRIGIATPHIRMRRGAIVMEPEREQPGSAAEESTRSSLSSARRLLTRQKLQRHARRSRRHMLGPASPSSAFASRWGNFEGGGGDGGSFAWFGGDGPTTGARALPVVSSERRVMLAELRRVRPRVRAAARSRRASAVELLLRQLCTQL